MLMSIRVPNDIFIEENVYGHMGGIIAKKKNLVNTFYSNHTILINPDKIIMAYRIDKYFKLIFSENNIIPPVYVEIGTWEDIKWELERLKRRLDK